MRASDGRKGRRANGEDRLGLKQQSRQKSYDWFDLVSILVFGCVSDPSVRIVKVMCRRGAQGVDVYIG